MTATQIYTKNLGIRSNMNLPVYPITIFEGVKNSKNQSLNDVIDELLKDINVLTKKVKELEKELLLINKKESSKK